MAGIGQCGNNTGLRIEITAAHILIIPKKILGIKGPRDITETSVFMWMLDGRTTKYEAHTLNRNIALCATP